MAFEISPYREAFELLVKTRIEMAKKGVTGFDIEIGFVSNDHYYVIAILTSSLYSKPSKNETPPTLYARQGFWITPEGNIGKKMDVRKLYLQYGTGNWKWF